MQVESVEDARGERFDNAITLIDDGSTKSYLEARRLAQCPMR